MGCNPRLWRRSQRLARSPIGLLQPRGCSRRPAAGSSTRGLACTLANVRLAEVQSSVAPVLLPWPSPSPLLPHSGHSVVPVANTAGGKHGLLFSRCRVVRGLALSRVPARGCCRGLGRRKCLAAVVGRPPHRPRRSPRSPSLV